MVPPLAQPPLDPLDVDVAVEPLTDVLTLADEVPLPEPEAVLDPGPVALPPPPPVACSSSAHAVMPVPTRAAPYESAERRVRVERSFSFIVVARS